jgi:3-deoxy-manno-octulosonate cytidylyltransferase (CMP-KDO synthetase)
MLIVIPARYASTRFPGKMLAPVLGKPLIQWTWEAARRVVGAEVVVATDDDRIQAACAAFGADVIRTSPACRNGTERVAEALAAMPWHAATDVVVNWQGDAPLISPRLPLLLHSALTAHGRSAVATPAHYIGAAKGAMAGHVDVLMDSHGRGLWFTRSPVFSGPIWAHVGMYAYRAAALRDYARWPESPVERAEGLEQLRWLIADHEVRCMPTGGMPWREVNYPHDVPAVEAALRAQGAV